MRHSLIWVLGAGLLLAPTFVAGAFADDAASSSKQGIGTGPAEQRSVRSSSASAPTPTQETGSKNQNGTVKAMNKEAQKKLETEGK